MNPNNNPLLTELGMLDPIEFVNLTRIITDLNVDNLSPFVQWIFETELKDRGMTWAHYWEALVLYVGNEKALSEMVLKGYHLLMPHMTSAYNASKSTKVAWSKAMAA